MKNISIISSYPRRGQLHSDTTSGVASYTKNMLKALGAQAELAITVWAEVFDGEREGVYEEDGLTVKRIFKPGNLPSLWSMYKQIHARRTDSIIVALDSHMVGGSILTIIFLWQLILLKWSGKDVHILLHKVIANWKAHEKNPIKRFVARIYATLYYTLVLAGSHTAVVFEDRLRDQLESMALQYRLRGAIEWIAHSIGWMFIGGRKLLSHIPKIRRRVADLTHVSSQKKAGVKRATQNKIVKRIEDMLSWQPTQVRVIPHAVEDVKPIEKAAARRRLRLDPNAYYVLCFGFFSPHKGLDELISMWPKGKSIRLILAGGEYPHKTGSTAYRRYVRRLQHRASKAGITITGFVPEKKIPLYFGACDVVVLPYRTFVASSGPLALAFAYEKPVLMSGALSGYFESRDFKKVLTTSAITKHELTFVFESERFQQSLRDILHNLRRSSDFSRSMKHMRTWKNIAAQYNELVK